MIRIPQIPNWCLTNMSPAFYDTESLSVLEQTARLYKTIQNLINDYNNFSNELVTNSNNFSSELRAAQEEFVNNMNEVIHDYIRMLDEKINIIDSEVENQNARIDEQDNKVLEVVKYFKDNLTETLNTIVNDMLESGEIEQIVLDSIDNLNSKYNSLESRLIAMENTSYNLVYDSYNEELTLSKVENGGV